MKTLHPKMTSKSIIIASIYIALSVLSTGATGQTIYKCGNNYSQAPCPGAESLSVDDVRDSQQKKQTDEAIRQDAKQAQSLEKIRVAQQMAALKPPHIASKASAPAGKKARNEDNPEGVHKIHPQHNKPDVFMAQVPGSSKKATKKKTAQKAASSPV